MGFNCLNFNFFWGRGFQKNEYILYMYEDFVDIFGVIISQGTKWEYFLGGAKFSIFWWVCLIFFDGSKPTVHIKKMKLSPLGLRQSIRPIVPHMIATHGCLKLHSL